MKVNKSKEQFKKGFHKLRLLLDSATFALVLSVAFFSYEMTKNARESEEVIDELINIKNNLTTRYLGLFPEYIDNINSLLNEAVEHQKISEVRDSVVIFQDVLYYGVRSDAKGFRQMITNILQLAANGCHITIAYYNPEGRPFKNMIRDKLISFDYQKKYRTDMESYRKRISQYRKDVKELPENLSFEEFDAHITKLVNDNFDNYFEQITFEDKNKKTLIDNLSSYRYVDSVICEQYYDSTRLHNRNTFENNVKSLKVKLPLYRDVFDDISIKTNNLLSVLDEIKSSYMKKNYDDIMYSDFYNMYKDMSNAVSDLFGQSENIELIPLNENMMMSCWLSDINGEEKAIFAFPSKYSTDEIGFISQDASFANYIRTMLEGIKLSISY